MKKVIIASENPVKVAVAKRAFTSLYPEETFDFVAVKSQSQVPDQPFDGETEQGALNRLNFIQEQFPGADFWISQEGGLFRDAGRLYNRAWIMVADSEGYIGKSSTPLFYLPPAVTKLVEGGKELGHAADEFFGMVNSKHGTGVVGVLTEGLIDRENYYLQAAIIAISQVKHKSWYENEG